MQRGVLRVSLDRVLICGDRLGIFSLRFQFLGFRHEGFRRDGGGGGGYKKRGSDRDDHLVDIDRRCHQGDKDDDAPGIGAFGAAVHIPLATLQIHAVILSVSKMSVKMTLILLSF